MTKEHDQHSRFQDALQTILKGDLDGLTRLLDDAPDLVHARTQPPANATLLIYTAFNGFDEVCFPAPKETPQLAKLLIERGADPDATAFEGTSFTPLNSALSSWFTFCSGVQNALADAYLDGGASIEGIEGHGDPLGHAIGFGYTPAVEHLANRGAKSDYLLAAAALGRVDQLSAWYQGDGTFAAEAMNFYQHPTQNERGRFSWPPPRDPNPMAAVLVTAATHDRINVVEWALANGADPNRAVSLDQTALHFAAHLGHAKIVDMLLAAGARTNIREKQFDKTAAEWAAENGEKAIVQKLESH